MNSIYAQNNHAKKVVGSFGEVLATTHEVEGETETVFVREAIRFFLEVLFMKNSLPLHRTFVSALAKTRQFHSVISSCFRELCDAYGSLDGGGKRFCVSRVALSVLGMPLLKVVVLLSLLKVCRTLAFLEGDIAQKGSDDAFAFTLIKGIKLKVPIEWLKITLNPC